MEGAISIICLKSVPRQSLMHAIRRRVTQQNSGFKALALEGMRVRHKRNQALKARRIKAQGAGRGSGRQPWVGSERLMQAL